MRTGLLRSVIRLFALISVLLSCVPANSNAEELTPAGTLLFKDIFIKAAHGYTNSLTLTDAPLAQPRISLTTKAETASNFGVAADKAGPAQLIDFVEDRYPGSMPSELRRGFVRDVFISPIHFVGRWTYGDALKVNKGTISDDVASTTQYYVGIGYSLNLADVAKYLPVFRRSSSSSDYVSNDQRFSAK